MLPRPSQRSIFHLGEEGGADDEHVIIKSVDATTDRRHGEARRDHGRQRRKRDAAAAAGGGDAAGVGLQILVQQHRHHTLRAPSRSHIVLKQVVLQTAAARHGSFLLRACSLCQRELSPNKDVYMYRGDQGFCSQECRWHQMLKDDARERDAMVKKERVRRGLPHHLHHGPRPAVVAAIPGAPTRRLVAVAY
ncbi:unnamed protein product [Urochloa humidicola]